MSELYLMITITNRDNAEDFTAFYKEQGSSVVMCALGRGTATSDMLDYLGLEDSDKMILFSAVCEEKAKAMHRELVREMDIDIPGKGIALSIPISSISGNAMRYLTHSIDIKGHGQIEKTGGRPVKTNGGSSMSESPYRLIIAIANQGYTDMVMEAARAAGASGGTIIHAKGTGIEQASKFFGMSIASEKEMIFIVCPYKDKDNIMKEIMLNAGMKTKAETLVMSVPIDSVVGLRELTDEEDEA